MIKLLNSISDVWRFVQKKSENSFVYLNIQKELCLYIKGERKEAFSSKVEDIEIWRDGYIINENQYFSSEKLESIFEKDIFKSLVVDNDNLIVKRIDLIKEEVNYGLYNYSSRRTHWLNNFRGVRPQLFVKDSLLISAANNRISCFEINNGNKWQETFNELLESERPVLRSKIIYGNDKLFFVLTGNQNKGLYVLDVDTGKLLKKYDDVCYEIFQDEDYIFSSRFENILCRINSKTLEIEEWDCNDLVKSNGFDLIHDHRCAAKDNRFYFTQTIGDNKAKLGILDWDKKDLIYKYEFEPKNGGIGSIQVNDSRMFVHTQDNTLHIFEID